jgi:hypothetical protein
MSQYDLICARKICMEIPKWKNIIAEVSPTFLEDNIAEI